VASSGGGSEGSIGYKYNVTYLLLQLYLAPSMFKAVLLVKLVVSSCARRCYLLPEPATPRYCLRGDVVHRVLVVVRYGVTACV